MPNYERYIFQESGLLGGSYTSRDLTRPLVKVKARSESRARNRLPNPEQGRIWILIEKVGTRK